MSGWAGYLLVLAPFAAIAYVVWSYRARAAAREAASRERLALLVGSPKASAPQAATAPRDSLTVPAASPVSVAPSQAARPEVLLDPPSRLVYLLIRAGLPDHEVLARVRAGAVLAALDRAAAASPFQPELDFVVCDKGFRVVCVLFIGTPATAPAKAAMADRLAAAGIRVSWADPAALPRRDAMRALLLGTPG